MLYPFENQIGGYDTWRIYKNQKSNEELVAIPEKYMLTIREAASYFNIGIKNMRRL